MKKLLKINYFLFFLALLNPSPVLFSKEELEAEVKETNVTESGAKEDIKLTVKEIKGTEKTLTLSMGQARELEFPFDYGSIRVGDPSLFDFIRIKEGDHYRKLRIVPKNSGVTDMTIRDEKDTPRITYTVRVTREDVGQVISQLEELLGDIEGLKIKSVAGTIILDGELILPKDLLRINRVIDALKERDPKKKEIPIRNLITISKVTMGVIAERIEREIGSPELTVKVINNNLFLEGTAESDPEADRALAIAKAYLPEWVVQKTKGDGIELKTKAEGGEGGTPFIVDNMRVRPPTKGPPDQDILVTINYVELSNDYSKSFNFDWKPLAGDNSQVKFDSTLGEISANLVATISNLIPKLRSASDHGHARVLKQQTIIVKNNAANPASVDSSLDIYTRIVNDKGEPSFQPITVQNSMKVKAGIIAGSDAINLGVQLSFNSLVGNGGGAPLIARNSLQTEVNVKNGDSAAIGGYSMDNAVASYNRDPGSSGAAGSGGGTGQTPLFNMNRSKGFQHNKQQYIIFVTPEIIRTASSATEGITRKFRLNAGEK